MYTCSSEFFFRVSSSLCARTLSNCEAGIITDRPCCNSAIRPAGQGHSGTHTQILCIYIAYTVYTLYTVYNVIDPRVSKVCPPSSFCSVVYDCDCVPCSIWFLFFSLSSSERTRVHSTLMPRGHTHTQTDTYIDIHTVRPQLHNETTQAVVVSIHQMVVPLTS